MSSVCCCFVHFCRECIYNFICCNAATPGRAQRVPVAMTTDDDAETGDADVDESEITDSDAENKLNPDEYEDDTTEFEQSEAAANGSQAEVTISIY